MTFHTFSTIGTFHTNHNEDAFITAETGENRYLMAVMDGCSSGIDSHFAATLTAKLLRRIAKELYFLHFVSKDNLPLSDLIKTILSQLFTELVYIKNRIGLNELELLNTLLLAVIDTETACAEIIAIGDGLVVCNGNLYEFNQNNKPDYLGYHLMDDFDTWYSSQDQKLTFSEVRDLSLCTDGIFSFRPVEHSTESVSDEQIINRLLVKPPESGVPTILNSRVYQIETHHGLHPADDLTIVRAVL